MNSFFRKNVIMALIAVFAMTSVASARSHKKKASASTPSTASATPATASTRHRNPKRHHSFGSQLRQKLIKPVERGGRQLARQAIIKPAERQAREYVKSQIGMPFQRSVYSGARSVGLNPRHSRPASNPKPVKSRSPILSR